MSDTQQKETVVEPLIEELAGGGAVVRDTAEGDTRRGRDPDRDDDDVAGSAGGGQSESERSRNSLRRARRKERDKHLQESVTALATTVDAQSRMIHSLTRNSQQQAYATLNSDYESAKGAYEEAKRRHAKAVTDGDGPTASEAMGVMQRASNYGNAVLEQMKGLRAAIAQVDAVPINTDDGADGGQQTQSRQAPRSRVADTKAEKFVREHPWVKNNDDPEELELIRTIDNEVARGGFKPSSDEYWEELQIRLKDELPHRFRKGSTTVSTRRNDDDDDDTQPRRRGGPPLGGSGRGSGGGGNGETHLSPDMVRALEEANIPLHGGDDTMKRRRTRIIEYWRDNAPRR